MRKDVEKYVSGCEKCQRTKITTQKKRAPLNPLPIPTRPWEEITWDLIGPLPESNGYNAILVIVNRFTKALIVQETNTEVTAEGVARIFIERVFRNHGAPRKIYSDR